MKFSFLPKKLTDLYQKSPSFRAFLFIFPIGLVVGLAMVFRSYVINTRYSTPSPLMSSRLLFEFTAFSLVAFLFPWSWNRIKNNKFIKFLLVLLTAIAFVLVYVFILSMLEWSASKRDYNLFNGYYFTLYHSGLLSLIFYFLFAGILYLFGITKNPEAPAPDYLQKVSYRVNNKTSLISVDEIQLLEANDNYVSIYADDEQKNYLIRETLQSFEDQLDPQKFQRIHRKYIINLDKVASWQTDPNGGYLIYLQNQRQVKMSKSYKEKLKLLKENQ